MPRTKFQDKKIHEEVKLPFGYANEKRHDSHCKSLHTMRGVGGEPRRQCHILELRKSAKIVEDRKGGELGIRYDPQGKVMSIHSYTTIVDDNKRCSR